MSKEFPTQLPINKAREEADLVQEKIKSGEAENWKDADMKIEYEKQKPDEKFSGNFDFEMRPEVIEKAMSKVQDINKKGIAYTVIDWETDGKIYSSSMLKSILKNGLDPMGGPLFFNIVGRSSDLSQFNGMEIKHSHYFREGMHSKITIIFDVSNLNEKIDSIDLNSEEGNQYFTELTFLPGKIKDYFLENKIENRSEIKNNSQFEEMKKKGFLNEEGNPNPMTEFGFNTYEKIKQNKFRGIVLKQRDSYFINFMINEMIKNYHHEKGNMLLPIYDADGNLLWPKNMKYDEVKKFVEERDKKAI